MGRIWDLVWGEPVLYLLGLLVSASLLAWGYSLSAATNVMFWWYLACAFTVGLVQVGSAFFSLYISRGIANDTYAGWNYDNRPSLQELKEKDPEFAWMLGEMYDDTERGWAWIAGIQFARFLIALIALVLGAFLLRQAAYHGGLWQLIVAVILLGGGLVAHSIRTMITVMEVTDAARTRACLWAGKGRRH
jgi:hypothetical protein